MSEDEKPSLFRAESEDSKYSNPMLRLFLTLGFLGIFGSIITLYMIVMSYFSRGKTHFEFEFAAAAVIAFVICAAAVTVLNIIDKKEKNKFLEKEKTKLKNAKRYKGKVIGAEKHINHVRYLNDVFDEVVWNFIIEYFDEETNKNIMVQSEKFLNDISEVLSEDSVTVCVLEDGTLFFEDYRLRESRDKDFIKLKIDIDEINSKV